MRALTPALFRVIFIIILLVMPAGTMAQDAGDSDQAYKFSKEELTQMLAPIALYPDSLTAQILIASTYPLEVVEADRWRSQNLQLKGNELDTALQSKDWDPGIKSLCHFPDILKSMSDKLDQTRKLGDAFLAQEDEVMATIQELRNRARDQGNLNTTDEQKVVVEKEIIRIEPANPQVVYVPVYDPAYVYGTWWYPAYPPYYWYYPAGYYSGAYVGFGPSIFLGLNVIPWVWFDWSYHRVHIDINRTRSFHRHHIRRDYRGNVWRHNPQHRRGVAYRDHRTGERFGSRSRVLSPSSSERRGYPGGRVNQQNVRPSQQRGTQQRGVRQSAPQTPQVRQAPATGTSAPQTPQVRQAPATGTSAPQTPQVRQAPTTGTSSPVIRREGTSAPQAPSGTGGSQRSVVRDTPFRGIGEGNIERRASERGGISNRGNEMRQQPGGFSGGQMQQRQGGGDSSGGGGSRGGGQGGGSRGGGQGGGTRR